MNFESIYTERLLVRRLLPTDADRISQDRNNPLVAKYQSAWSCERALNLIEELIKSSPSAKGRWFQFGIEVWKTRELIGDIGFLNTDENEKCWIGFTLDPEHWGNGYATEAASAVLDFYSRNNVDTAWASTEPENDLSARVLHRLGFTLSESTPTDMIFRKKLRNV